MDEVLYGERFDEFPVFSCLEELVNEREIKWKVEEKNEAINNNKQKRRKKRWEKALEEWSLEFVVLNGLSEVGKFKWEEVETWMK